VSRGAQRVSRGAQRVSRGAQSPMQRTNRLTLANAAHY